MRKAIFFLSILLLGFLMFPSTSWGLMSSTNYTIFADSVDSGGSLSTGGVYNLQDTTGESPVGSVSSSTYQVIGGYQAMDRSILSISVSAASIDLGNLTVSAVATSSA